MFGTGARGYCHHKLTIVLSNYRRIFKIETPYIVGKRVISMPRFDTRLTKKELQEGKPIRVDLDGNPILLALVSGKVYAMDAVCSHEGGPLEEGTIEGYSLTCPWHAAIFDIRSARVSPDTGWATDLKSYEVIVEEKSGKILVETEPYSPGPDQSSHSASNPANIEQKNVAKTVKIEDEPSPSQPLKMQLKLIEKIAHKGTDITSFKFSRGDGQNNLNYRAGQYSIVDLGTKQDPKGPIRSFTISSSPTERDYILITTRIRDSPFKQKLSKLDIGTSVKITAPAGQFTLPSDDSSPVVFLSGGIGVTPFRSMIKYVTDKQLPLKITLFDSNRNQSNILYKEEFDSWANLNKHLKVVYTITDEEPETISASTKWKGEKGRIDGSMLERHMSKDEMNNSVFYICGPPVMLNAMQKLLSKEIGVPANRIKIEEFIGY